MYGNLYLRLQIRRWDKLVERQTVALETLAQIATDQWAKGKVRPPPKQAEIGEMDLEWLNTRYTKEQEAMAAGMELEEEE